VPFIHSMSVRVLGATRSGESLLISFAVLPTTNLKVMYQVLVSLLLESVMCSPSTTSMLYLLSSIDRLLGRSRAWNSRELCILQ